MVKPAKNTICLWYDRDAEDAARFYAKTFPDSSVGAVHRAPGDFPSGKKGDVLTVEFTVMGIPCLGLNGGPAFKHNEAFSFQVATADQAETDRYWNAIVGNGGQESACGWCKDKWGLSWQITPIALTQSDHRSRSRCRQARVRCDDGDEKDRHRRNRGGAPRLNRGVRWPLEPCDMTHPIVRQHCSQETHEKCGLGSHDRPCHSGRRLCGGSLAAARVWAAFHHRAPHDNAPRTHGPPRRRPSSR